MNFLLTPLIIILFTQFQTYDNQFFIFLTPINWISSIS